MPEKRPEVLDFLLTRRSRPAKTLAAPVPSDDELRTLLRAAGRVPDHGKLGPWRFIVLKRGALQRLASAVVERGKALGIAPEAIEKMRRQFADSDLAVAVIASPKPSEKVPEIEQILSAGAAALSLLNAALAAGWGANWLTGWAAHDRAFVEAELGLEPQEFVAGFIHIGTETVVPPERPRPDVEALTRWVEE